MDSDCHFNDLTKPFMQSCLIYPNFRIILCIFLCIHIDCFYPQNYSSVIIPEKEMVIGM